MVKLPPLSEATAFERAEGGGGSAIGCRGDGVELNGGSGDRLLTADDSAAQGGGSRAWEGCGGGLSGVECAACE